MNIENATLFVTGANRGLGRALVEEALARGARRVYAAARDVSQLGELLTRQPGRVLPIELDVTRERSVQEAAARAGDVEVLINNAGLLASFGALTSPFADIQRDFDTNFFGLLSVSRAFVPVLTRARGAGRPAALVNVLSVAALASVPPLAAYSASKAAALSVTQALRAELASQQIRVHGVLAGAIDTDMVRAMDMPKTSPGEVARGVFDGLVAGLDEIAPDPMSKALLELWRSDPKALEQKLAAF